MNEVNLKEQKEDSDPGGDHNNGHQKTFEIIILYNGIEKKLSVNNSDLISAVLSRAIALFGGPPNPHTLALYTHDRGELQDGHTVKEAGVTRHEKVLLRPSTVKAG